MEDAASGSDEPLLTRMKALARRGAMLRRQTDGAGVIEHADQRRAAQPITPQVFLRLLDAGWLRAEGADRFVISRRGATALRNMLNRPAAQRRTAASEAALPLAERQREAAAKPLVNDRESPLAWFAQRRDKDGKALISQLEFDAGERLRADFERAQMGQRVTAAWDAAAIPGRQARGAPGVGMEIADVVIAARQRVEAALRAVGPELSGVLLDVCCFLKGLEQAERNGGWPRRSGKVVLQLGLAHLARHYGLDRRADPCLARVATWHAPGWPRVATRYAADEGGDEG